MYRLQDNQMHCWYCYRCHCTYDYHLFLYHHHYYYYYYPLLFYLQYPYLNRNSPLHSNKRRYSPKWGRYHSWPHWTLDPTAAETIGCRIAEQRYARSRGADSTRGPMYVSSALDMMLLMIMMMVMTICLIIANIMMSMRILDAYVYVVYDNLDMIKHICAFHYSLPCILTQNWAAYRPSLHWQRRGSSSSIMRVNRWMECVGFDGCSIEAVK